jgi:hypothetical protein
VAIYADSHDFRRTHPPSLVCSRPHRAVVGLAVGTAALSLALPFLPANGQWFNSCTYLPPILRFFWPWSLPS